MLISVMANTSEFIPTDLFNLKALQLCRTLWFLRQHRANKEKVSQIYIIDVEFLTVCSS